VEQPSIPQGLQLLGHALSIFSSLSPITACRIRLRAGPDSLPTSTTSSSPFNSISTAFRILYHHHKKFITISTTNELSRSHIKV
jgi:hypothetical protein